MDKPNIWDMILKAKKQNHIYVTSQQKYEDVEDIFQSLTELLAYDGAEYVIKILVIGDGITLMLIVSRDFGIAPVNISKYREIINKIEGISYYVDMDGKLRILFSIKDVFIET